MRRFVAGAGAAALAILVAAAPVGAHEEGWAGSRWRTEPGTRFTQPPKVSFTFQHEGPAGIERVALSVAMVTETEVPPACLPPAVPELVAEEAPNPLVVDDVALTIPCNGRYTATATARTRGIVLSPEEASPPITLAFDVAVPPAPPTDVAAEVTQLDGDTATKLTWKPPQFVPPDFVGYQIARSRSAKDGFEVVGESVEPTFVDGEAAEGGTFHYRVQSVRLGATSEPGDLVASEPTAATAIDVPAPSTTTTAGGSPTTAAGRDLSGFGSLEQQAARLRPGAVPPGATIQPGPVTTIDSGFQETLPFDPANPGVATTTPPGEPATGLAAGGSSQIFEDDAPSDRKTVLAPVAGALALLVVFLQLRWLLRQAQPT